MTSHASLKGKKIWLILWYSNEDTAIQSKICQDKVEANKFYDDLTKRDLVHAGIREETIS